MYGDNLTQDGDLMGRGELTLADHSASMNTAGARAEQVEQELRALGTADGEAVRAKVRQWVEQYHLVQQKFETLRQNSESVRGMFTNTQGEAGIVAQSAFDARSADVVHALS
ncbi:hypothetical protein [Streptomyces sp. WAC06614]|uniref:hypothetical protein n=1 Tax=Streptomyces sp. WAC06614 TaxID=2487416 RepID=UPI000F76A642|nr:hypothetical protein [Streptomyces sp. WAC06614]RSS54758.1 hypothetical protein EF918_34640 [Streptomyces sp. WAC06614]